jgi:hypothetical protein
MIRAIATITVVLAMAAGAQATPSVYAEITYPTATTWKLWVTECDWTGSLPITPAGFGIAGLAIPVRGALTADKATPTCVNVFNNDDPPTFIGQVGFPIGGSNPNPWEGTIVCAAGQDLGGVDPYFYGFGVWGGSYSPPSGLTADSVFSWAAPGAPFSDTPGVLAFQGKRDAGQAVTIAWDQDNNANVFAGHVMDPRYSSHPGVQEVTGVSVVPEPCTALLLLLGLAMSRRRRA